MTRQMHCRAILVSFLAVWLCSCAREDFGHRRTEKLLPAEFALEQLGMEKSWHCDLQGKTVRNVYVLDGLVCVESTERKIYAIGLEDGLLKWQYALSFFLEYPPCDNEDKVFMLIGSRLYALAKHNGHVEWHRPLDFNPTAPPTANVGLVAIPGRYILNTVEAVDGTLAWYIRLHGQMFGAAGAFGDFFYVGDDAGWVYGISARMGEKMWQKQTRGAIKAAPFPMADVVYVGSDDYKIYALDPVTGVAKWEQATGSMVQTQPLGTADAAYVLSHNNGVMAYDAITGEQRWCNKDAARVLAVGAKRAYLMGAPGVVLAVNVMSGALEKKLSAQKYSFFPTNYHTDHLILVSDAGMVVALREKRPQQPQAPQAAAQ